MPRQVYNAWDKIQELRKLRPVLKLLLGEPFRVFHTYPYGYAVYGQMKDFETQLQVPYVINTSC